MSFFYWKPEYLRQKISCMASFCAWSDKTCFSFFAAAAYERNTLKVIGH